MSEKFRGAAEMFVQAAPNRPSIDEYAASLEQKGRITPLVTEALAKARAARVGNRAIFYIAGPLTNMSEATKQRYVDLSKLIADNSKPDAEMLGYAPHVHGTDPVKHPGVSANTVRDVDYLWAGVVADAHINILDPMGHGNAVEAGWAEQLGVPSLYMHSKTVTLSRLLRGMHNVMGTIEYRDFRKDGLPQVQDFLTEVQAQWAPPLPGIEQQPGAI